MSPRRGRSALAASWQGRRRHALDPRQRRPWRDLPERYGKWNSVYARFKRWRSDGTWSHILSKVLDRLDVRGRIDHDLCCIDSTIVRAARRAGGIDGDLCWAGGGGATRERDEPEGHALGYSWGGLGIKVHLPWDGRRTVLGVLPPRRRSRRRWPSRLAGDKGYSYPRIWRWLDRRRSGCVIPTREDQPRVADFEQAEDRRRNISERVIGWYTEFRRLLTRFEKLAVNDLAFWIIASIFLSIRPRKLIDQQSLADSRSPRYNAQQGEPLDQRRQRQGHN